MAAPVNLYAFQEPILFLVTAGVVVPVFTRMRFSPVIGFLVAGALLGPSGLGRLTDQYPWINWLTLTNREGTSNLAEFGVVFLLFTIGIELSWQRLKTLRRLVFGFGSLQVLISATVLGLISYHLVDTVTAAVLVGLAFALSSTAIVVPVLAERRRLNTPTGRVSFSVLLFQDLAVAPILFAIAALDTSQPHMTGATFVLSLAQAALALALIVGLGRIVLRPFFQLVAATKSSEFFMAACLLVVLVTSLAAAAAGLSMALGAFIAGLLLAETEYRRAVDATIQPFKGLLLGVFFVSVGMNLDFTRFVQDPAFILVAAFMVVAVKTGIVLGLGRLFRLNLAVTAEAGLILGAGGEFALVILGGAMAAGLLPGDTGQNLLLVTSVSMVMIPGLARLGRTINKRLERKRLPDEISAMPPPSDDVGRVIIAGFGRVGQLVAEMLERHKIPYLALDLNPARVAAERRAGKPVYFGDGSSSPLLRACGVEHALALVVTLDTGSAIEAVVTSARQERADIQIVARARDAKHAAQLYELGVDDAVPETIEASLQLTEAVLVDIGVPMGHVIASIHERRDEFRSLLRNSGGGREDRAVFRARRRLKRGAEPAEAAVGP
jgi:CPA2 family monovalent cation:H+ antiporter-2